MITAEGMEGKVSKDPETQQAPKNNSRPRAKQHRAKKQPRKAILIVRKAYNSLRRLTIHKKGLKANFNPLKLKPEIIGAANTPCLMEMQHSESVKVVRGLKKILKKYLDGKKEGDTPGFEWKGLWQRGKEV